MAPYLAYRMLLYFRLLGEAARFAGQALRENLLRTLLSLLGVTVGIFAIVMVFTAVDSLERNIRTSMAFLGDKVIYVQKWPWIFGPNSKWWRYISRPETRERDYHFLLANTHLSSAIAMTATREDRTLQAGSNSTSGVAVSGVTYFYNRVKSVPVVRGRYFTEGEVEQGRRLAVIGADIAANLFPNVDAVGRKFSYKGTPFQVIGVMQREGKTLLGTPSNDIGCIVPFEAFKRIQQTGAGGSTLSLVLKGQPKDEGLQALEGEVRSLLRRRRALKPWQEDNFAINRPEMVSNALDAIFIVFSLAGGIIGSFSILVGGFGIANIMFVSVRERTNLIGIQKSLGAKSAFILWQFLFEAMLLSLAGGALGVGIVYLITLIPQDFLVLRMSVGNVLTGVLVSSATGLVAGLLPALQASRLDPVEAIRSK